MEEKHASVLIKGLSKHQGIMPVNEKIFMEILASFNVPDSSRFHERMPVNPQLLDEGSRFYLLSLRRVLRNANAGSSNPSKLKQMWDKITLEFGAYNSTALTRDIRRNSPLVEMMRRSEYPFSLLGKFETYEVVSGNSDQPVLYTARPILIIPGVSENDLQRIYTWEEKNIRRGEESPFARYFKRMKLEYSSQSQ